VTYTRPTIRRVLANPKWISRPCYQANVGSGWSAARQPHGEHRALARLALDRDVAAWENSWNSLPTCSAVMPMPVSATESVIQSRPFSRPCLVVIVTVPFFVAWPRGAPIWEESHGMVQPENIDSGRSNFQLDTRCGGYSRNLDYLLVYLTLRSPRYGTFARLIFINAKQRRTD
jgi:hypothetical protein